MNPTIVFPKPREVIIEDQPTPVPSLGEVLIQTRRTLISTGTELTVLNGDFPGDSRWGKWAKFPFIPGYSNAGVVIDIGQGVDASWKGRRVITATKHAAFVLSKLDTSHQIFPIPQTVPDDQAVFFHIAATIVMNGIRRGNVRWGESVVIYGLGLLGQLAARFCHLAGARPVIGIDVSPKRLGMLPITPGFEALSGKDPNLIAKVKELTKERMADVIFEITGNQDLIPKEFALLKEQGRFVMLSSPRGPTPFDFHDLCNAPSFTIIGAHGKSTPTYETPENPWTKARHIELFFDMIASGSLDLKPLITEQISYSEAPSAYERLLNDRSQMMGTLIQWS